MAESTATASDAPKLPPVRIHHPHLDWPIFREELIDLAITAGEYIDPIQGLCGAFMSPAEHIVHFGALAVPIVFQRPAPLAANATVDQQRWYDRSLAEFKIWHELVTTNIKQPTDAAIPKHFFAGVAPPAGQRVLTIAQKFAHMEATYAAIPQAVLKHEKSRLSQRIPPAQPLLEYFKELRAFVIVSPATSQAELIDMLQCALSGRPLLGPAFSDYFKANPLVQTLNGLILQVEAQAMLNLQLHPASSMPFSAYGAFEGTDSARVPVGEALAATAAPSVPRSKHYCWSHGVDCNHASKDMSGAQGCKYPFKGHKKDATAKNKMGGATYVWHGLSKEQQTQKRAAAALAHESA